MPRDQSLYDTLERGMAKRQGSNQRTEARGQTSADHIQERMNSVGVWFWSRYGRDSRLGAGKKFTVHTPTPIINVITLYLYPLPLQSRHNPCAHPQMIKHFQP
jgi:hypothetical protein